MSARRPVRVPGVTTLVAATALLGAAGAAALVLRRRFVVITVSGVSMEPTYHSGQRVLVRRTSLDRIRAGDVVVLESAAILATGRYPESMRPSEPRPWSEREWLIKRAVAIPGDPVPASVAAKVPEGADGRPVPPGRMVVLGDNAIASADSRSWGYASEDRLLGVVVRTMSGRGIAGPVSRLTSEDPRPEGVRNDPPGGV